MRDQSAAAVHFSERRAGCSTDQHIALLRHMQAGGRLRRPRTRVQRWLLTCSDASGTCQCVAAQLVPKTFWS